MPGKPQESYLIERVTAGEMPPESRGVAQPIPGEEIALLEAWIAAGANWPADRTLNIYERTTDVRGGRDWWSLQPVVRPEVPRVSDQARVANPIDAFIVARLEQKNIEPAPPADRRTMVAYKSWTGSAFSTALKPKSSVAPWTRPPFTPPPASQSEKP